VRDAAELVGVLSCTSNAADVISRLRSQSLLQVTTDEGDRRRKLVGLTPAALDLDPLDLLAGTAAWVSLGLVCGSAAFAVGAGSGRRLWAIAAGAGVAVAGYVIEALANNSDDLGWVRAVSPYAWAYQHTPLADGFDGGGLALLWAASLALLGIGAVALARRDILS